VDSPEEISRFLEEKRVFLHSDANILFFSMTEKIYLKCLNNYYIMKVAMVRSYIEDCTARGDFKG